MVGGQHPQSVGPLPTESIPPIPPELVALWQSLDPQQREALLVFLARLAPAGQHTSTGSAAPAGQPPLHDNADPATHPAAPAPAGSVDLVGPADSPGPAGRQGQTAHNLPTKQPAPGGPAGRHVRGNADLPPGSGGLVPVRIGQQKAIRKKQPAMAKAHPVQQPPLGPGGLPAHNAAQEDDALEI